MGLGSTLELDLGSPRVIQVQESWDKPYSKVEIDKDLLGWGGARSKSGF